MDAYKKIYDDTDKILGKPVMDMALLVGRTNPPTDDTLDKLNEYAKPFITETHRGLIKTILIVLKPYKDNPRLKDTRQAIKDNYERQYGKLI